MSLKYQSTYRCYLIDHHSPQPPIVPLGKLDIAAYEQFLREAHVDSEMVYCKDHWGCTYYPSQVGGAQLHQGVPRDWMAQVKRMLAENDIEFIAYYCIEYDEGAARRFPAWRARTADGLPLRRESDYARWSLCCYQTGYRRYCLDQLREIVSLYSPDALFLDIFGASLCYCESCRAKFLARFGYPLPKTEEQVLAHKTDILAFLDGNAAEFLTELQAIVYEIDPALAITINFSCHYPVEIRGRLDYQFSEPLLKDNWFSAAYARDTAVGQYPILAPGEATQVYNYSPVNQYLFDLSCIAAQGCRVGMYSGAQHIDGTLDFEEARRLGAAYRELDNMRPYLTGRTPVSCIGILQSDLSAGMNLDRFYPDAILRAKIHSPHMQAILGAMMLCENAKLPWSILPENSATAVALARYDCVLLPELFVVSDVLRQALTDYVARGGVIILSAGCGRFDGQAYPLQDFSIADLIGAELVSVHEEYRKNDWSAYLTPQLGQIFDGLLSCTTPPVSETFTEVMPHGAEPLLRFILPCVPVSETEWVNWWSPPPGTVTDFPALLQHRFGEGTVFYCAFDLFTMATTERYNYLDELFGELLVRAQINPLISNRTDTPVMLRTAFFERKNELLVHQISTLPHLCKGQVLPIGGGILSVDARRFSVKNARVVYPTQRKLSVRQNGDRYEIELPDFAIQQIISVER